MYKIEIKQGTWTKQTDGTLKGILGSFTKIIALAGSELDENYEINATVKLVAGKKAGIIVAYTEDEIYTPTYLECLLDVDANILKINGVIGETVTTLFNLPFPLALEIEYDVRDNPQNRNRWNININRIC